MLQARVPLRASRRCQWASGGCSLARLAAPAASSRGSWRTAAEEGAPSTAHSPPSTSSPPAAAPPAQPDPQSLTTSEQHADCMQTRYENAFSMAQLYAKDRPPPIPLEEHERRRKVKDANEVVDAGRRRGIPEARIRSGLGSLDSLLPNVLSLHRMKPADWATVAADINVVAEKLVLLKSLYPQADIFRIVFRRPKLLITPNARLEADARELMRLLANAPNPCAVLEATPDLLDPVSLSRCLASLAASFPGRDPVALLVSHPDVLANSGSEALVELTAEYGELSTKD